MSNCPSLRSLAHLSPTFLAGAGLLALTTACWSTRLATETASAPPSEAREDLTDAETGSEPRGAPEKGPTSAERGPSKAPNELGSGNYTPPKTIWRTLENGCRVVAREHAPSAGIDDTALLRLVLPYGRSGEPRIGLTELSASLIVQAPCGVDGRASLRDQIARLGGHVSLAVGTRSTVIDLTLPKASWIKGLNALVDTVRIPASGKAEVESIRELAREQLARAASRPGLDWLLHVLTAGSGASPSETSVGLEDRTVEEVEIYAKVISQPNSSVLVGWVPGVPHKQFYARALAAANGWRKGKTSPLMAGRTAKLTDGVTWAAVDNGPLVGSDFVEVGLLIPEPPLSAANALEERVLLECLSLDGVDGRLGQRWRGLNRSPLSLAAERVQDADTSYRVLRGVLPEPDVLAFWDAVMDTRGALYREPPNREELNSATQRIRLQILATEADPHSWLQRVTAEARSSEAPADIGKALARLRQPGGLRLTDGGRRLAQTGVALAVVGDAPSRARSERMRVRADVFLSPATIKVPRDNQEQIQRADVFLADAMRTVGGVLRLRDFNGYAMRARVRSDVGVQMTEWMWLTGNRLRRVRQVLTTTIETILAPEGSFEQAGGGDRVDIEPVERDAAIALARIHPLYILASYARGKMRFRYSANRQLGDREVAVLEQLKGRPRLRIFIDVESGLIREIELREYHPGIGPVHVRRFYEDYRPIDGLRAPYHITIQVDDNRHPLTIDIDEFFAREPNEDALRANGPKAVNARSPR